MDRPHTLQHRIGSLNALQIKSLGLSLAQRLFPNYRLFAEITETGDPEHMQAQFDLLWLSLETGRRKLPTERIQERLEKEMPNPANYDCYGVFPALDAALALSMAVDLFDQPETDLLLELVELSRQSVVSYLDFSLERSTGGKGHLKSALDHELMQAEEQFFADILDRVENWPKAGAANKGWPSLVRALRERAENDGVSNIGISIDQEQE